MITTGTVALSVHELIHPHVNRSAMLPGLVLFAAQLLPDHAQSGRILGRRRFANVRSQGLASSSRGEAATAHEWQFRIDSGRWWAVKDSNFRPTD
jgi:hypothetical protein